MAIKSLGPGKIVHTFQETEARRSLSSKSAWDKQIPDSGVVVHTLIWATPSAGDLAITDSSLEVAWIQQCDWCDGEALQRAQSR